MMLQPSGTKSYSLSQNVFKTIGIMTCTWFCRTLQLSNKQLKSSTYGWYNFRKAKRNGSRKCLKTPHQAHPSMPFLYSVISLWNFQWLLQSHHCSFLWSSHIRDSHSRCPFCCCSRCAVSASTSLFTSPSGPMLDPYQFLKKEDFDRLTTKTEGFIEKTAKNQEDILYSLRLLVARLTYSTS